MCQLSLPARSMLLAECGTTTFALNLDTHNTCLMGCCRIELCVLLQSASVHQSTHAVPVLCSSVSYGSLPTQNIQAARSWPEAAEEAGGGDLDASILCKGWDLALRLHHLARHHHSLGEDGCACK